MHPFKKILKPKINFTPEVSEQNIEHTNRDDTSAG